MIWSPLEADHIIARQSSVTGSIGVLIQTADITEFLALLVFPPKPSKAPP